MNYKLAFIGVGNMATATLLGISSGADESFDWKKIILFDSNAEKLESYRERGAYIASSLFDAIESADIVFLCVKPQNFPEILPEFSRISNVESKIFVTIAAGISMKTVSDAACGAAVVRVMPNTPMLIGKGMIALCRNDKVSDEVFCYISDVFRSSGNVITIDESQMNRIISVTGSSPAYVFMMIKAMYQGAVEQGLLGENLSEKDIINSICNAIIGSAELMKAGNKTPDEQIATVCSKGGTTERAVNELNNYKFCEGIVSAMEKCTQRADELGASK